MSSPAMDSTDPNGRDKKDGSTIQLISPRNVGHTPKNVCVCMDHGFETCLNLGKNNNTYSFERIMLPSSIRFGPAILDLE
jgi:hypothetical protein